MMTNIEYLKKLLPTYESYFDISGETSIEQHLFLNTAQFHSRSEKYILIKSAKIWAHETNEYVYFSSENQGSLASFQSLKETILKHGLAQIKPHSEHMYSYVTLILIVDALTPDIIDEIQKTKFYQSFWFSLRGWMYLRIAAVDLSNGKVYTNKKGKELLPLLSNIF